MGMGLVVEVLESMSAADMVVAGCPRRHTRRAVPPRGNGSNRRRRRRRRRRQCGAELSEECCCTCTPAAEWLAEDWLIPRQDVLCDTHGLGDGLARWS